VADGYDFIIFDAPPSLGLITSAGSRSTGARPEG